MAHCSLVNYVWTTVPTNLYRVTSAQKQRLSPQWRDNLRGAYSGPMGRSIQVFPMSRAFA